MRLRVVQIPLVYPHFGDDEEAGHKLQAIVASRRSGKSMGIGISAGNDVSQLLKHEKIFKLRKDVDTHNPLITYYAPTQRQAKSIMWKYVKQLFDKFVGIKFNNTMLTATIPRPLTNDEVEFQLLASRNADRSRGLKIFKAYCDESQDCPDYALKHAISPALSDSAGKLCLTGTADLGGVLTKRMSYYIKNNIPTFVFPADRIGIFTQKELDAFRIEVGDDAFEREYLCSFKAAIEGVIYYKHLKKCEADEHFNTAHKIDGLPTVLACDLGVGQGMCGWVLQVPSNGRIHVLDYFEGYEAISDFKDELEANKHYIDEIALPHDGDTKRTGAYASTTLKKSFEDVFTEARVKVFPRTSNLRGAIENVVQHLHLLKFPPKEVPSDSFIGLRKLKRYRRKVNKDTGVYLDIPDKSQGDDHAADALRTAMDFLKCRRGVVGRIPNFMAHRVQDRLVAFPYRGNPLLENRGAIMSGLSYHGYSSRLDRNIELGSRGG